MIDGFAEEKEQLEKKVHDLEVIIKERIVVFGLEEHSLDGRDDKGA